MRVVYDLPNQKAWEQFFAVQALQSGHGLVGYRGTPYQRGSGIGSLLGGLVRSFLPIAKTVGKTVGKQVLRTGAEVAADALSGRNIGEALEDRGKAGAVRLLVKGVKKMDGQKKQQPVRKRKRQQKGRGLGFRPVKRTAKRPLKPGKLSRAKRVCRDQLGAYLAL
jgi:hypothetical protein